MSVVKTVGLELKPERLEQLIQNTEIAYGSAFCNDDSVEAFGKLRMAKGNEPPKTMLGLGLKMGIAITLLVTFALECIFVTTPNHVIWNDPVLYIYAVIGNLIVFRWCWGINVYIWESAHVNYIVLFEFSSHHMPHYETIFNSTANITIGYLVNIILYFDAIRAPNIMLLNAIPCYVMPLTLAAVALLQFLHAFLIEKDHYGLFSPSTFMRLFTSHLHASTLKDRFAGDVMTSFTKELSFLVYGSCYITSGAFQMTEQTRKHFGNCSGNNITQVSAAFMLMPLVIRFVQSIRRQYDSTSTVICSWPNGFNAMK